MKKQLQIIIGFLISIIFLYLAVRKVNFREIIRIILSIKIKYLIIAFIFSMLAQFVRSKRWQYIVNEEGSKYFHFFEATCVGLMTNNLLPFRIGDFVQAFFLSFKTGINKPRCFSTVVMERLVDLFFPLTIIIFGSFFVLLPQQISKIKIIIVLIVLFSVLFFAIKHQHNFIRFLENYIPECKLKQKFISVLENFFSGLKSINNKVTVLKIFILSLFVWIIYILSTLFALEAFNINLTFFQSSLVMAITAMSVVIPSSPGYIGTWEFFTIISLSIFGITKTHALSYALLNHFISWFTVVLFGFIVLIKNSVSLSQIENAQISRENNFRT